MSSRPNIIFIIADDMGYGDLGCFNYDASQTPALDQRIHEGVSLTQHYLSAPARRQPERVNRMQAALTTWFEDVEQERRNIGK